MQNKTLWWFLLAAWIGVSTYWHVCKIKELCDAPLVSTQPAAASNAPVSSPLTISDGPELNLHTPGNYGFAKSEATANSAAVKSEIDSLMRYLLANPNKRITITGSYSPEETNTTTFPDLGIARASDVKKYFVNQGLPDSIFTLKSQLNNEMVFVQDSLKGGIDFTFSNFQPNATENDLANAQKYESIFKPMDLYFPTASADYIKTNENAVFLAEAKKYLTLNKDKKLKLTGHTDNEDSAEWNLTLSKKRALAAKNQFVAAGIAADRIITDGKGESEPKASNDTPEGKRANRRVTIVVQ